MDGQRDAQLKQLANIVIDAYLNRDQQFTPMFPQEANAVLYLSRPEIDQDHPGLRTNVWYERSDYEALVNSSEKKTEHHDPEK